MSTETETSAGSAFIAPVRRVATKQALPVLRWRLDPREAGLAGAISGPRSSGLYANKTTKVAWVAANGRSRASWYWVAGWDMRGKVRHRNTCDQPCASEAEAKTQALEYVRACLLA